MMMKSSRLKLFLEAASAGNGLLASIEATADHLAKLMQQAHGGEVITLINHEPECEFVVVRIKNDMRVAPPKRGQLV